MLLNVIGCEIQDLQNNFNFYRVITDLENMTEQEEYYIEQIREYFHNQCELSQMEIDHPKEDPETKPKVEEADLDLEEEKVDTSEIEPPQELKKIDPTLIPTNLYLITPDYFFTLPKICKTLEQLTKEYYSKK